MAQIGHEVDEVYFHSTSFLNEPFYMLGTGRDVLRQAVHAAVFMVQPELGELRSVGET